MKLIQDFSKLSIILIFIISIFFIAGCSTTEKGAIVQYLSNFSIKWAKCLGGSTFDTIKCIKETSDGGFIAVGGTTSNDGDISGNNGSADLLAVKFSSTGSIEWSKCYGGSSSDGGYGVSQTTDGGYIITGYAQSNDGDVVGRKLGSNADVWIVKLTADGDMVWNKCYGGSQWDEGNAIIQNSAGKYVFCGTSNSTEEDVSGAHGANDIWVVQLSQSGTIEWQKCVGGTSSDDPDSILQTADMGYIIGGASRSNDGNMSDNHGENDACAIKLTSTATVEWTRSYGGTGMDEFYDVALTSDGGYIFAGYAISNDGTVAGANHGGPDAWLVKITSNGTFVWQQCMGGTQSDYFYRVSQTGDGGYMAAGSSCSLDGDVVGHTNVIQHDYWVVKLLSDKSIAMQECLGGSGADLLWGGRITSTGKYIVAGESTSTDKQVEGAHGDYDAWIALLGL